MTDYIAQLRHQFIVERVQDRFRQPEEDPYALAESFAQAQMDDEKRAAARLAYVLGRERPVVFPEEKIALLRTVPTIPELHTEEEQQALRRQYYIHERGRVCNVTPDYSQLMTQGLDSVQARLNTLLAQTEPGQEAQRAYWQTLQETLHCVSDFARRYQQEALRVGNDTVAHTLARIPAQPPESFLEALQFLRLLHYCLWASGQYHNTLGRFDQYLWPYLKRDLERGMTKEEALELVEEFFLCCNKDSDLYPGMQQGDNGQSIVLGGRTADGADCFNLLSELCLTACGELRLIDPKLNLRVHDGTPLQVYEQGTRLTKLGLGFPQYTNDEVVIPCLLSWGYAPEDAYQYSIAACWEIIIPGEGPEIPNINGLSFAGVLSDCLPEMEDCVSFDQVMEVMHQGIQRRAAQMMAEIGTVYLEPAPLLSMMMHGCIERGQDCSIGGKYNNYGFHGTGIATAVDSLAAIQKYVFQEGRFTIPELEHMLALDFQGYERELHLLRYEAPKMGNDEDETDAIAVQLLDWFADALEGKRNDRGGIYRPGTGSAMYYLWHAQSQEATPDGRKRGEPLPCNYSPSLFVRTRGPVSIIKSFSKPNLRRVANGGPLTIELHDSVFRAQDSVGKVARFVRSFMQLGGHQMQINAVNRAVLEDAKRHPEQYRNLIVRVWGWSGYFVELDEAYQDHIIRRAEMTL